jgi:hypothetical protein
MVVIVYLEIPQQIETDGLQTRTIEVGNYLTVLVLDS